MVFADYTRSDERYLRVFDFENRFPGADLRDNMRPICPRRERVTYLGERVPGNCWGALTSTCRWSRHPTHCRNPLSDFKLQLVKASNNPTWWQACIRDQLPDARGGARATTVEGVDALPSREV